MVYHFSDRKAVRSNWTDQWPVLGCPGEDNECYRFYCARGRESASQSLIVTRAKQRWTDSITLLIYKYNNHARDPRRC